MTSRGKSGISSVVAALFTVVIVFFALVPTFLFTQSLYSILSREVNERRYFEIDRSSEDLEVFVMQIGNRPNLKVVNTGPISLVVVRVWAYRVGSVDAGHTLPPNGPCYSQPVTLNPGSEALIDVSTCVQGYTGYVMFKVVTERGRQFTSDVVFLQNGMLPSSPYPFTLTVSIINMQRGKTYTVEVTPLDDGLVSPRTFTHKATASNENVTVAFGTTAGTFRVTLYENNRFKDLGDRNPQTIKVPDYTAVIFNLGRIVISPVDLEVVIVAPREVRLRGGQSEAVVQVSVFVKLPREAQEPVTITDVQAGLLSVSGGGEVTGCSTVSGIDLRPNQMALVATCSVTISDDVTLTVPAGVIAAEGEDSGLQYFNSAASFVIDVDNRGRGGGDGKGGGGQG
jgi:hypothetical protein